MSGAAMFARARYELPVEGGPLVITPLGAAEGDRLGVVFAAIDPWAAYAYPAAALSRFLAASEPAAQRLQLSLGDDVAGAAVIRTRWLRGPYLQFLAVVPGLQGRGIGSTVLRWMEREARMARERNLWVVASEINAGAMRFYERHGFEPTARLDDLVCDGRTEILMRKRL
ncbi:MAG: GNAT family N-acetyltransferase [Hyphomicrobium sp.]|uniref:GNAT family N-acetyltransferase n=1 Tax=Hyphomicrobium sp. TaxID=82 RepID=UPI0022CD0F00|nr:GNAT family N-acetyltransferase [Hyphomicrobium sp.]MBZ0210095.1 GNAT family N-acetyltransferase [Hyphomicrobium sp.]MCZ7593537.1 GNAT family N-acetyltransferase [Hyphomicrobium sp.]